MLKRMRTKRAWVICLSALLSFSVAAPVMASAQTPTAPVQPSKGISASADPGCGDSIQPEALENSKISIVLDPTTAWQPRSGTVSFTISGNKVSLGNIKIVACFGWPEEDWSKTRFIREGRISLVKFDESSATYSVVVPDLVPADVSCDHRTALCIVPLATMRIIAYGGEATPTVDVQLHVGITSPLLALALAVLSVAIAFLVFYSFGHNRGVPGKGLLLWMISTRNGVASLSQAQIMLWTFLIGASAVYVMALSGVLIDIPDNALILLGIAGVATVGSKLQNSRQDAEGTTRADGKTAVPGKVINLVQVGAATDSEVRLAWAPPTNGGPPMRYFVEYQQTPADEAANAAWSTVGETITRPHHTILGLAPATRYTFQVRAVNAGGPSDPTTTDPIRTVPRLDSGAGAPGPVGGLRVADAPTQRSVKLEWSPASGAPTNYPVQYRRHDTIEPWTDLFATPQQKGTADNLTSGVAYDFRVAAANAVGHGLWSAVVTVCTLRDPQWADLVVAGDGRGEIDVTRAQMLFFTLVTALFVGMKVLTSYVIPAIPDGILLLMGISNGVYMTAKFLPD